ncbi:Lrp/AsnC family transcriptional regulator [Arthrobacter koreensis]
MAQCALSRADVRISPDLLQGKAAMATDQLDARIVSLFTDDPRMSVLEASRTLKVARATVQARLDRMQRSGVIAGWGPRLDPAALGYVVTAYCSLTIRQDMGHDAVVAALAEIPEIQEAHTVSGESDLIARVAARSNSDLQRVIDSMVATGAVLRSSSVIVLNTHFEGRMLPLLHAAAGSDTAEPGKSA